VSANAANARPFSNVSGSDVLFIEWNAYRP
jgi:hypothetical protein